MFENNDQKIHSTITLYVERNNSRFTIFFGVKVREILIDFPDLEIFTNWPDSLWDQL